MMDDWAPLQPAPWTPSLLGSADRPRPVLRIGLVMAQASTDPKGLYYGVGWLVGWLVGEKFVELRGRGPP